MKTRNLFLLCIIICICVGCNENSPESWKNKVGGTKAVGVDLGDGLIWAEHNLGASSPEDFGCCFSWGDLRPFDKMYATNNNYCFYTEDEDGNRIITKYVTKSMYGTPDYLFSLLPEDDPATVYWGDGWRTPTMYELLHLYHKCEVRREDINGVKGLYFTAPNGNSIYIPANKEYGNGNKGVYWCNTLDLEMNNQADAILFRPTEDGSNRITVASRLRTSALGIRPVKDKAY